MRELHIPSNRVTTRALRDGRKTQTRLPIRLPNGHAPEWWSPIYAGGGIPSQMAIDNEQLKVFVLCRYAQPGERLCILSRQTGLTNFLGMSRRVSRTEVLITDVGVERLQAISEADAEAEGALPAEWEYDDGASTETARESFQCTWDSAYVASGYGWDTTPWVWVVMFKKVEA